MILEPPDLTAADVLTLVREHWDQAVCSAEHAPVGAGSFHWIVSDLGGPRWFATADASTGKAEARSRLEAYVAAAELGAKLDFVLACVPSRKGLIAVEIGDWLLSVAPHVSGISGTGRYSNDGQRASAARLPGLLHSTPAPSITPRWSPVVKQGEALQKVLARSDSAEDFGPYAELVRSTLASRERVVVAALTRFDELAERITSTPDGWVLTHGEPHTANLIRTRTGLKLVDWDTIAIAPRERDLRDVLGNGTDAWAAYVEAGGDPEPLSVETLELFALEWHLAEIAEYAYRFSQPHEGTEDDARCFTDFNDELSALVSRWA